MNAKKKAPVESFIPGQIETAPGEIVINVGRQTVRIAVANTGDRPIQVGSHYHFFETNDALEFDRAAAWGCRLNIPAGTAVRFEPGQSREVELVEFAGDRQVYGFAARVMGPLDGKKSKARALPAHAAPSGEPSSGAKRTTKKQSGRSAAPQTTDRSIERPAQLPDQPLAKAKAKKPLGKQAASQAGSRGDKKVASKSTSKLTSKATSKATPKASSKATPKASSKATSKSTSKGSAK